MKQAEATAVELPGKLSVDDEVLYRYLHTGPRGRVTGLCPSDDKRVMVMFETGEEKSVHFSSLEPRPFVSR